MSVENVEFIEAVDYRLVNEIQGLWPWRNFTPDEIRCKGTGAIRVNVDAMNRLQAVRDALGVPMKVNSAYRSPDYNAQIGGAKGSLHVKGKAFDIAVAGLDPRSLFAEAKRAGFTGFGFYRTFLHIDTGRAREWGAHKGQYV